ncbi:AraC family transcriptional regulator, partial [Gordonia soli]
MSDRSLPETDGTVGPVLRVAAGRAVYVGPSLRLAPHSTSVHCLVVGVDAPFDLRVDGIPDVVAHSALVSPRRVHQVVASGHTMMFGYLDATAHRAGEHLDRMLDVRDGFAFGHRDEDRLITLANHGTVGEIDELLCTTDSSTMDVRIRAAIDHLADPDVGPTVDTSAVAVAARVAMSPSHFLHVFAAQTGTSFRRYKLWLRMLRVAAAIADGQNL